MTLLDEKITALFRRGSPIFNSAESTPSVDRPIAEKAASEAVVSEPAVEEAKRRGLMTGLRWLLKGWQSKQTHHGRDWIWIRRSGSAGRYAISKLSERN